MSADLEALVTNVHLKFADFLVACASKPDEVQLCGEALKQALTELKEAVKEESNDR